MSDPNQPYHNKGFGPAFLWIIFLFLILPTIVVLSIDDGWATYKQMRGFGGDCWENSKHEKYAKVIILVSLEETFVYQKYIDGEQINGSRIYL